MKSIATGKILRVREDEEFEFFCDFCNESLGKADYSGPVVPIRLNCQHYDYGEIMGEEYLFCSTTCFRNKSRSRLNMDNDPKATIEITVTVKEFKDKFIYNEVEE